MRIQLTIAALAAFVAGAGMTPAEYGSVALRGHVGERLDACLKNHVVASDPVYLATVFRAKNETSRWQTEFWGKWMHSAIPLWICSGDAKLKSNIYRSLEILEASQLPDGYIGNYREDRRCCLGGWDVWGMKYTLLGLIHAYDGTGEKKHLDAAVRLADYLIKEVGPNGKQQIYKTGNYRGMPSCSVLEPVVWLYNRTKEPRFLEFAKYIVAQLEEPEDGAKLISRALNGVDVADRTPLPKSWWTWENGQKAYEMMSCYQGLLEYYEATGDKRCLDAAVATAENIVKTEINIAGGGTSSECWYHGKARQTQHFARTMETCVLTTWMRLCEKLLLVTGDPKWADELEKCFLNAYLGSLRKDGAVFAQYSALSGFRSPGEAHCKMETNCCNANGPRGFLCYLRALLTAEKDAAVFNLYETSFGSVKLPANNETVSFETFTMYPKEKEVTIWNRTEKPLDFALKLRIPAWSEKTVVKINGKAAGETKAGAYMTLRRTWQPDDCVEIAFDMTCRVNQLNDHIALVRGPIVLARDARFGGGETGEVIREFDFSKPLALEPVRTDTPDIWMTFSALLPVGCHSENPDNAKKQAVKFCDYSSSGGTWTSESTYRVWLPVEINAAKRPYNL